MGFKKWLRKLLIDEVMEQQTPPQLPPVMFRIDDSRHNLLMSIMQGNPLFAIYNSPTGLKTIITGLTTAQIRTALDDIANQIPEMKDVLTNVAIDINAPQHAKQSENR